MLNRVTIIGNLGADPEMRYTANGTAITTFRVAVGRTFTVDGERREETEWFRCVAWEKLAELVQAHLTKGRRVYVEGRQQTRSWDGPDGAKKYATELIANSVLFLDKATESVVRGKSADTDIDPEDVPFEM